MKLRFPKNLIAFFLTLAMALSLLTGCGKTEDIDLEDVYTAIMSAQPADKDTLVFFETDADEAANFYDGLKDYEYLQERYYMAPVTGAATELILVQAKNKADVQDIKDMFQARVDEAANNVGYAETAKNWKLYAQVQSKGTYVGMIVLPQGYYIPDDIFDIDSYRVEGYSAEEQTTVGQTETEASEEIQTEETESSETDENAGNQSGDSKFDITGHEQFQELIDSLPEDAAVAVGPSYESEYLMVAYQPFTDADGNLVASGCEVFGPDANGTIVSYGTVGEEGLTDYPMKGEYNMMLVHGEDYIYKMQVDDYNTTVNFYIKTEMVDASTVYYYSPEDGIDENFDDISFWDQSQEEYEWMTTVIFARP